MPAAARARRLRAPPFVDPPGYARHRPEVTLLYRLIEQHCPAFRELRAGMGRPLPDYVELEFEAYLKCGRLEEGFLRVVREHCHAEKLVAFSCKKRGFCPSCGAQRMAETAALLADEVLPERPLRQWVLSLPHALRFLLATDPDALTLVQRFGSSLNLNVHFHMLLLDGVYLADGAVPPVFRHVAEPGAKDLQALVERIAASIGSLLEKRGIIERDSENAWLSADMTGPLDDLLGHSITYRIVVGPRAGQKLFTLQTVPARLQGLAGDPNGAARSGGFSLHAGIDIAQGQRAKLERLCRYVSRPPVATERLALTPSASCRSRSPAPDALDQVPRRVRPAQPAARGGDAGASRYGCIEAAESACPGRTATPDAAARGHELGTATEAGIRNRDRGLRSLRRQAGQSWQRRTIQGEVGASNDECRSARCIVQALSGG